MGFEHTFRWMDATGWRIVLAILMDLTGVAAVAWVVRYILYVSESYALFVPLTIFGIVPLGLIILATLETVVNKTRIWTEAGNVHVKWGPLSAGERHMAIADIDQLFALRSGRGVELFALDKQGTAKILVQRMGTTAAQELEQALEARLSIPDRPVANEIPKGVKRKSMLGRQIASMCVCLVIIGAIAQSFTNPPISGLVAQAAAKDGSGKLDFELGETTSLEVWTKMEITGRGLGNKVYLSSLPHTFDVRVAVKRGDGQDYEIACNPFNIRYYDTQSTVSGLTETSVYWFGVIDQCSLSLPQGRYIGTAEVVRREGGPAYSLDRADVLLRLP